MTLATLGLAGMESPPRVRLPVDAAAVCSVQRIAAGTEEHEVRGPVRAGAPCAYRPPSALADGRGELVDLLTAASEDALQRERARELRFTQRERARELRFTLVLLAVALLAAGVYCCAAAMLCHLALALPLTDLWRRPNLLPGLISLALGVLALAAARRTAVARSGVVEDLEHPPPTA